ncbi:MAG: hypothetical protein IKL75_02890 [Bacteroidaceae bacterium]|nr:hypothetical protein [Bacteroidaceae bacterium]
MNDTLLRPKETEKAAPGIKKGKTRAYIQKKDGRIPHGILPHLLSK